MTDVELRVQVGKDLWAMYRTARSFEFEHEDSCMEAMLHASQNGDSDWDS